ncbi:MAG: peptidase S46 [Planctomycetes bacterium RBG_13_62_9]|nr:MAG: peptidase S46 [Planctomycetes bacterium RBG_13_62_9]
MTSCTYGIAAMIAMACLSSGAAWADEGMWLFNNPPRKLLQEKYNFTPGEDWYVHLQRSSVRFNSGGSGSFVSADGLVLTNHHVGSDCLQKLSTKERDLVAQGFYARTLEEEIRCVDLELNVLQSVEDVTERINAAVKPGMSPAEANQARRAAMNTVEKESLDQTGLRSDVVTLYHGGLYHLYRFKKYTDVRIVFAPEKGIAFFGGDPDNFEFPRYDLDICFFRVYEDGKPAKIEHYLKWSPKGADDGELVFVSGHPGRTDRLDTMAHIEFLRDKTFPNVLRKLFRWEVVLSAYSAESRENARRAEDDLFSIQNSRKARLGMLAGLQDPSIMGRKREDEQKLRQAVQEKASSLKEPIGDPWAGVAATLKVWDGIYYDWDLLEQGSAFRSQLFRIARTLVRLSDESAKPNADRLREYRESNLESLRFELFSEAPIYEDLETVTLADSLSMLAEMKGIDDPLVQKVLAGKSPRERAAELVNGTRLKSVESRKRLAEMDPDAIRKSDDPMIQLAVLVDPPARSLRKTYEDQVEEPQRQAYAKLAAARFAIYGTQVYPDATFTLRLAFGPVKGYVEQGKQIPPWTTFTGLYRRAEQQGNRYPFELPQRWIERRDRLDLDTPCNFVSTADIIGGNSGSPVVNRNGAFVGIIFDGNIQSLVLDFIYTEQEARAVSVHSAAILEALRKVYDADRIVKELAP